MLRILQTPTRLCDGITRREAMRIGGLSALGLSLPQLLASRQLAAAVPGTGDKGTAKSCIVLFLMGGAPQHSTFDPKPDAPALIRGDFGPISTAIPGVQYCELLPRLAQLADRLAVVRAMSTSDNAHSSSGYFMLTGVPHSPQNRENVNPGFPNDFPQLGAIVRKFIAPRGHLPAAMRLPHRIYNTDGSVWPGQDGGFLGRAADPWLLNCRPADPDFRVPEFELPVEINDVRLSARQHLLEHVNRRLEDAARQDLRATYGHMTEQAFDLLHSRISREAFRLERESPAMRDRYGHSQFGQSVLLGRRLVEAGVSLVQVNWFRGPEEPYDAPCWDSHVGESARLKNHLCPPADQAISALIEDLEERGLLDETLVVCMGEFGRSPRMNRSGGRDHWGNVFSVALAGGGIRGGTVYGASDAIGGFPKDGKTLPQDLSATILHCLGLDAHLEIEDSLGRRHPISRGTVIRQILG